MKNILITFILFTIAKNNIAQNLLIPYRKGSLWGYANEEGKVIVTPKFTNTYLFGEEKYKPVFNKDANNNLLTGYIKNDGKVIIEPIYKQVYGLENETFVRYQGYKIIEDNKYGEYSATTKNSERLSNNYFVASMKDDGTMQNYMDSTGKILLKDVENINIIKKYGKGFFDIIFKKNKLIGIADYNAKIILQPKYEKINYVNELNKEDYYIVTTQGKTALITGDAKIIIPFAIQTIDEVKYTYTNDILFRVGKNKQQAIYNNTGKKLIGFTPKYIEVNMVTKNGKRVAEFNLIGKKNNEAIIQEMGVSEKISYMPDSEADKPFTRVEYNRNVEGKNVELFTKGDLYGLKYVENSTILIPPIYKKLGWCLDVSFQDNVAINYLYATTEKGVGIINAVNKIIIPIKYKDLKPSYSNNYQNNKVAHYIATKGNLKKGLLNHKNEIKIPFEYKDITDAFFGGTGTTCNFFVTNKNDLIGVVNSENKNILPEVYSSLQYLSNITDNNTKVYFIAKLADKGYGIIDKNNVAILPIKYDSILNTSLTFINNDNNYLKPITDFYFPVIENKKYAYVKSNGDYMIPPQNDELYRLLNPQQNEDEYYAVTKILDAKKRVFEYGLISNKRVIPHMDSGYFFPYYNVINDYKKGIIQFENLQQFQGMLFTKLNIIIPPAYFRISKSYTIKNHKLQYYELEKRLNNGESYVDIINENGLQFFEN